MYSTDINKLIGEASKLYSKKEYDLASEKYAEACELYATEAGADDPDLLLLYGKSLFQNAVSKSEVFGGGVNTEKSNDNKDDSKEDNNKDDDGNFQFCDDGPLAEEEDGDNSNQENKNQVDDEEQNLSGSEDDNDGNEEEQSDFEVAWEILDLARALFEKKVDTIEEKNIQVPYLQNDKEETTNEYIILTKKLSETYDLLGEVSLEAENFPQSAIDLEKCLKLRFKLYNRDDSPLISESHYKLSLALEFCVEDVDSREKAAEQMYLAIESVKLRNKNETDSAKQEENEELLKDLEVRYRELKKDPEEEIKNEQIDIIKGILGEATSSDKENKVNDLNSLISKSKVPAVNDLTSMVKKRNSKPDALPSKKAKK